VTVNTDWSWRFPLALQVLFAAVTILLSFFLPGGYFFFDLKYELFRCADYGNISDSPRALIKQGHIEQARDVVDMLSTVEDPITRSEQTVSQYVPFKPLTTGIT
jgi:hypothetical protein